MAEPRSPESRVLHYFRTKSRQLLATSELPVCEHSGLSGSHREEFQRVYLKEILPRRFDVGRGMVYGLSGRSREADIVIWDAVNYPSLPMIDHSFYFAESARVVIEAKSRWSMQDWRDVRAKTDAVRHILLDYSRSLEDEISMLQLDVHTLKRGEEHSGMLIARPKIGTAAVFIEGGRDFTTNPQVITEEDLAEADFDWPDLTLFLREGVVISKEISNGDEDVIAFRRLGEDSLLFFTNGLLRLLAERTVSSQGHFYLDNYMHSVLEQQPYAEIPYFSGLWRPGRIPLQ
ncbi:DUF6602 domain-containing protein [Streptomyces sp. NPDC087317]|uniref:DUF6602 domain-containing protein n=1 Tax=Streptomyces sp. NPDC087317 TaxID=3365784 RepID=UPI0038019F10